jgi:hypothetical protein
MQQIFHIHNAGIVDKNIDCAKQLQRPISQPTRVFNTAQIRLHAMALTAKPLDRLSGGLEADRITAADHKIGSCGCQTRRDFSAEPARGPRDQGTLIIEIEAACGSGHAVNFKNHSSIL